MIHGLAVKPDVFSGVFQLRLLHKCRWRKKRSFFMQCRLNTHLNRHYGLQKKGTKLNIRPPLHPLEPHGDACQNFSIPRTEKIAKMPPPHPWPGDPANITMHFTLSSDISRMFASTRIKPHFCRNRLGRRIFRLPIACIQARPRSPRLVLCHAYKLGLIGRKRPNCKEPAAKTGPVAPSLKAVCDGPWSCWPIGWWH